MLQTFWCRKGLLVVLAMSALGAASVARAETSTNSVAIQTVRTGWSSDSFAIVTKSSLINPAGCSSPDGYAATSDMPGYKTFYAAALTAVASGKNVRIVVSDSACVAGGRQKIVGVEIVN